MVISLPRLAATIAGKRMHNMAEMAIKVAGPTAMDMVIGTGTEMAVATVVQTVMEEATTADIKGAAGATEVRMAVTGPKPMGIMEAQ